MLSTYFLSIFCYAIIYGGVGVISQTVECQNDIDAYVQGLQNGENWALKMFDSATKIPSGLMDGNVLQMGNYDECLEVEGPLRPNTDQPRFTGFYCRVRITDLNLPPLSLPGADDQQSESPLSGLSRTQILHYLHLPLQHSFLKSQGDVRNKSLQWAVCAPSSCGIEGVKTVAEYNLNTLLSDIGGSVQVEAIEASCYSNSDGSNEFDPAAWGLVGLAAFLCFLVIVSSAYHYYSNVKGVKPLTKALIAFSLQKNLSELFYIPELTPSGTIQSLHGLRVLSVAWVIFGHRVHVQTDMANMNALQIAKLGYYTMNMIILNAYLSVETFFLLSGFLVSYTNCARANRGHSFNLIHYYVNRYVRLTVPLALLVFFLASMSDKVVRGPLMDMYIDVDAQMCRQNWWATLLYVNNYVNNLAVCGGQTWYLSVDMQLAVLAPILLYPLMKWPKPTVFVIGTLALASSAAVFATTYINDLFWTNPSKPDGSGDLEFWLKLYSNTPMRAAPFLVGMAVGYALSRPGFRQKMRLTTWQVYLGWALNTAMCLAIVFTLAIAYKEDYQDNNLEAAFYGSLHRLGWSIGISWIIFACFSGYGGWVNEILSWRYFLPFSKLSYCYFLTHYVILFWHGGTWRNPHYFSYFECVHSFFGDLFVIFLPSLLLYLAAEAPTIALLRQIFKKS